MQEGRRAAPAFRFTNMPQQWLSRPSPPLPRDMGRRDEILLYRARLGMLLEAGGYLCSEAEDCPLCGEEGAMRRRGGTLAHLLECPEVPLYLDPPPPETLWLDPKRAVVFLRALEDVIRDREQQQ